MNKAVSTRPAERGFRPSKRLREDVNAWALLLPSLVFLCTFTVFPIARSIYLSFCEYGFGTPSPEWIGLKNYYWMFGNATFWKVFKNSVYFALMTVVPSMIIGLMMAMVLNGRFRGLRMLRVAFFYPSVMPMIAIASVWMFVYTPKTGMLDQILNPLGIYLGDLLSNRNTVLPAMAVMYLWKESGYLMIFILSGLQNLSEELFEAATIDGASAWTIFRKITMPLLGPTMLFVTTIAMIDSFKLVDHVDIMTQGMPNNASSLLLYYIYQVGYFNYEQGRAAALTIVLLVMMMIINLPRFFSSDKKVFYG